MPLFKKLFITFLLSVSFLPCLVLAEGSPVGLSVNPQKFEMEVFPGDKFDYSIDLRNLSDVALPVKVRMADFSALDDTGEMVFSEAESDSSKWFKIGKPDLILGAGEGKKVDFKINIPESAEKGGYYNVMIFEPQMPSTYFKEGQPRAVPVIGVIFLISVRTLSIDGQEDGSTLKIVDFSIPKEERTASLEKLAAIFSQSTASISEAASSPDISFAEKTPSSFLVRIKNTDIYHVKSSGKVAIYDIFGREIGESSIEEKTILPGRTRLFKADFSLDTPDFLKWMPASISGFLVNNFFIGKYQAKVEVAGDSPVSGSAQASAQRSFSFFVFAWSFWLPVLAFLIVFLFLRKRIARAFAVLIGRSS
jgi:hypothetical protein